MATRRFVVFAPGLVLGCLQLYSQADGITAFDAFLAWAEGLAPDDVRTGREVLAAYRSKLIADGRSSADSDLVINEIVRVMGSDSERGRAYQRLFYNKVYQATKATFDEGPNKLLVETVESLKPGKALDIAMGQGRNTVFLATRGWDVTGFDIAEEGLQKAAAKANQLGVRLRVVKASVEDFDWGTDQWDLIVRTYAPDGPIERALKPGGVLVIETFLIEAKRQGSTPANSDAIGPNDLLRRYPSLRVLRYEDVAAKPEWGSRTEARIVRMVARKDK